MAAGKKARKFLLRILGSLLLAVLLILAAASLILAKPKEDRQTKTVDHTAQSSSPALEVRDETDLYRLVSAFPAPVMSFMSGSGMTFVSAVSSDAAVSGGFGRVASLYWQTDDGIPLILQSICPADALNLLGKDFHFSSVAGPTLFGEPSVRMEKEDTIRIHTTTDEALYVLTLPAELSDRISDVCRSLQLFTVHSEE